MRPLTLVLIAASLAAPASGDDRDLLRRPGADPYLFVLLDTSASMARALDGSALEAGGEDPRSRIYLAKEALYDTLKHLDGVRFGFATFDQDRLHVRSKRRLFYEDGGQTTAVVALEVLAAGDSEDDTLACGKAFSGGGWEGNYDTGRPFAAPFEESLMGYDAERVDAHCVAKDCGLLRHPTSFSVHPDARELDRGDLVPFHWSFASRHEVLRRLNPNHGTDAPPEFGAAPFFEDRPDAGGRLPLKDPSRIPLMAAGPSPVADAVLDFRCWYMGPNERCGRGGLADVYTRGFMKVLQEADASSFGCRRPVLLVVSDLESNCPGEAPLAEVLGMNAETGGREGVSTWIFDVGTRGLGALVNAGSGRVVPIASRDELRRELRSALGVLAATPRSFAAAAVPPAAADADEVTYLTRFVPRQESPVWEGHVHAFRRPLPAGALEGAAAAHPNHLWDAADVLLSQAPDAGDLSLPLGRGELRIGAGVHQRRLLYAVGGADSRVPRTRSFFGPYAAGDSPAPGMDLNAARKDLWRAMGIVGDAFTFANDPDDVTELFALHGPDAAAAHEVFRYTYGVKEVQPRDDDGLPVGGPVSYVLGDTFHARPLVVGGPAKGRYLARPDLFPGYQELVSLQARRRKVLIVASNDGQLHAFDAGRFQGGVVDGAYDHGTGVELFAYVPRPLLATVTALADPRSGHRWGLDGTPAASDVFIDPRHGGRGSADPPKAADREWRTVLVGGMRRGGRGYYALDLTRPDAMIAETKKIGSAKVAIGWKPARPSQVVPDCFQRTGDPKKDAGACDPPGSEYPAVLWELSDPDLGDTWSSPDVGAIRVIEGALETLRYVAVFGGGMDPSGRLRDAEVTLGRFLYMVDVETGAILYKRRLEGAAASAPAAVDVDRDGVLDRVYVGTTEGLLYRVDLDPPASLDGGVITDKRWEPYAIFDTASGSFDGGVFEPDPSTRKPIFFPPSVIFSSRLGRYALAFGTGNRENLWASEQPTGNRFYLFADDGDTLHPDDLPRYEHHFEDVTGQEGLGRDLLQESDDGRRGWFIRLGATHERVMGPATAISGVNVFPTFVPETNGDGSLCSRRGVSRVYTQLTSNGAEVPAPGGDGGGDDGTPPLECLAPPCERQPAEVDGLVSDPFLEQTGQPCAGAGGMAELLKEQIFPSRCSFASYRWTLSVLREDAGVECLAEVPVCVIEKNWKDF